MLIPYCVSVAALPLGAAGRKFSHYEVLSGPDAHHRKRTGWWDMHELGMCWGNNTDTILKEARQASSRGQKEEEKHPTCCLATGHFAARVGV